MKEVVRICEKKSECEYRHFVEFEIEPLMAKFIRDLQECWDQHLEFLVYGIFWLGIKAIADGTMGYKDMEGEIVHYYFPEMFSQAIERLNNEAKGKETK